MTFGGLPRHAAWEHRGTRKGFEVVFLRSEPDGFVLEGETAAGDGSDLWAVRYAIRLAADWSTRSARLTGISSAGRHEVTVEADGAGSWHVDGEPDARLDGCLDVDLESSALTNALPVHRLGLEIGQRADTPAAYVRAGDLTVGRLEQRYLRLDDHSCRQLYAYAAPQYNFECELTYDESGLIVEYPGLAVRAA